jgi:hypothetical protein
MQSIFCLYSRKHNDAYASKGVMHCTAAADGITNAYTLELPGQETPSAICVVMWEQTPQELPLKIKQNGFLKRTLKGKRAHKSTAPLHPRQAWFHATRSSLHSMIVVFKPIGKQRCTGAHWHTNMR